MSQHEIELIFCLVAVLCGGFIAWHMVMRTLMGDHG